MIVYNIVQGFLKCFFFSRDKKQKSMIRENTGNVRNLAVFHDCRQMAPLCSLVVRPYTLVRQFREVLRHKVVSLRKCVNGPPQ